MRYSSAAGHPHSSFCLSWIFFFPPLPPLSLSLRMSLSPFLFHSFIPFLSLCLCNSLPLSLSLTLTCSLLPLSLLLSFPLYFKLFLPLSQSLSYTHTHTISPSFQISHPAVRSPKSTVVHYKSGSVFLDFRVEPANQVLWCAYLC